MILNLEVAQEQLLLLFEQHLYVLADPFQSDDLPAIAGEYIKTEMNFTGDVNGQFVMLFPEDKSKEIMSNFLGLDYNDPQIEMISGADAAAEIVNILGAHILSAWLKDKGKFNIGLPVTSLFTGDNNADFLLGNNITGILIDGEPVFLKIIFK